MREHQHSETEQLFFPFNEFCSNPIAKCITDVNS